MKKENNNNKNQTINSDAEKKDEGVEGIVNFNNKKNLHNKSFAENKNEPSMNMTQHEILSRMIQQQSQPGNSNIKPWKKFLNFTFLLTLVFPTPWIIGILFLVLNSTKVTDLNTGYLIIPWFWPLIPIIILILIAVYKMKKINQKLSKIGFSKEKYLEEKINIEEQRRAQEGNQQNIDFTPLGDNSKLIESIKDEKYLENGNLSGEEKSNVEINQKPNNVEINQEPSKNVINNKQTQSINMNQKDKNNQDKKLQNTNDFERNIENALLEEHVSDVSDICKD